MVTGIRWRIVMLSAVLLGSVLVGTLHASPAAALPDSTATTSWGVEGLMSGTVTNGIKSEVFAMETIGNVLYVGG